MWPYLWLLETMWFVFYTGFVVAIMQLMVPNSKSKLLAQIEEVLDETLTEVQGHFEMEMDDIQVREEKGVSQKALERKGRQKK